MHIVYLCAFYGSERFMGMNWEELHHELICNFMKLVANNFDRDMFMDVSFFFIYLMNFLFSCDFQF